MFCLFSTSAVWVTTGLHADFLWLFYCDQLKHWSIGDKIVVERKQNSQNSNMLLWVGWGRKTLSHFSSQSLPPLFLLQGFLVIIFAIKQAMRLASQYRGRPRHPDGKHHNGVDSADPSYPLEYIIYRLNCIQNEAWRQPESGRSAQEKRKSTVFRWGVEGRDWIQVNDFEAGWLWPAMTPDFIRGSRQREVLCLIWP